jgi:uncharacterized protein YfaS (alpha-2-macroglobulin family)
MTDEQGQVTVKFTMPDTLTTYRCTAVAVQKDTFGIKEAELKVQNPINIRTAFPRRLRYRDTAIGSVLVTNLDGKEHTISLGIESDLLGISGASTKQIIAPADTTLEVPFKFLATEPGEAEIVVTTQSGVLNERLREKMIVEKPYVFETFCGGR